MSVLLPPGESEGDLGSLGVLTLARLTHEAEDAADDLTFLALMAEIEGRSPVEREAYRLAYIEQHKARFERRKASTA